MPEVPERLAKALGAGLPLLAGGALALPRLLPSFGKESALFAAGLLLCAGALLALSPWLFGRLLGRKAAPPRAVLLLGTLSAGLFPLVVVTGGKASPLLFCAHALAVAAGAMLPPRVLAVFVPSVLSGLALALFGQGAGPGTLVVEACLFGGFSMLGRALLFGAVSAATTREQARRDAELLRWYDDARLFRVVGRLPEDEAGEKGALAEAKRLIAGTEAVRDGLYRMLRLGAEAIRPDAAFLYLLDASGEALLLREQALDLDDQCAERLSVKAGPIPLALKRRKPVRLVANGERSLSDHRQGPVKALLVAPLIGDGHLVGVLGFDRATRRPFTEVDERVSLAVAGEILHLMRTEQLFGRLDSERREKARVVGAARAFGGVVKKEDAVRVALKAALQVAQLHAVGFFEVLRQGKSERVRLLGAGGEGQASLSSSEVASPEGIPLDPESWLGRAIRQGAELPHVPLRQAGARRGLFRAGDGRADAFGDLRVLPLFAQGECIGALVVATEKGARLSRGKLDSLGVVADLAGVAFAGAGHYEALERQATTDGLTGLKNRRTLDEKLREAIARAARTKNPLSLILTDVDHFKSVNDTYGHQVGDDVLVGVARTLLRCARSTDVVARYGGEEFCLVLEDTDATGAAHLAERIRRSVMGLRFDTDLGPLEVTSSFGVAELGKGAEDAEGLLRAADEALYRAKERGRNRVEIAEGKPRTAPFEGEEPAAQRAVMERG